VTRVGKRKTAQGGVSEPYPPDKLGPKGLLPKFWEGESKRKRVAKSRGGTLGKESIPALKRSREGIKFTRPGEINFWDYTSPQLEEKGTYDAEAKGEGEGGVAEMGGI